MSLYTPCLYSCRKFQPSLPQQLDQSSTNHLSPPNPIAPSNHHECLPLVLVAYFTTEVLFPISSSDLARLTIYLRFVCISGLAASLSYGAAVETLRRASPSANPAENGGSLILTPANISRLVAKLSKMRGAALKLGQFMSIQGKHRSLTMNSTR